MTRLKINNLVKTFGDGEKTITAVENLSLDIQDGEFLIVVGPSGCGKSTTLRSIAGLESPDSGSILLGDDELTEEPPQQRPVAMVFQSYALYPHMTVRENMAFGLRHSTDCEKTEIDRRVTETAEMLDIPELLDRQPTELSGGQQQRVALGRAIVREPEAFLLDEPLANLDAKLRAQMRIELQKLHSELGVTTIYVTHDQTEAMTMADRIAIMNDGQLQQIGTPLECYHKPANRFVAGFIGEPSMNFLEVEKRGDSLAGHGFDLSVSKKVLDAAGTKQKLTLGVRPELINVEQGAVTDSDGIDAVVDVVEPIGKETNIYMTIVDSDLEFMATIDGRKNIDQGERVIAHIPEEAIHLFDADTGDALINSRIDDEDAEIRV
ncbi:ABC transporter ATP-binding protein [Halobellus ruber]|uniref:ABC-type D-xylose/L-arabinose transporter n=1 Tax=Halobellus ruber TaxID=2761102 RepID=A0A7J9SMU6_9EURY|nr:sn-glycerol-3-phosphate ABC transporter ATP-binding protein UgpC [Halobellus ruber]MBB6647773.1 sn-glycerol-3-phosphate ABC transporter ATP-binding protein UgpC [Halobellus ruber]